MSKMLKAVANQWQLQPSKEVNFSLSIIFTGARAPKVRVNAMVSEQNFVLQISMVVS